MNICILNVETFYMYRTRADVHVHVCHTWCKVHVHVLYMYKVHVLDMHTLCLTCTCTCRWQKYLWLHTILAGCIHTCCAWIVQIILLYLVGHLLLVLSIITYMYCTRVYVCMYLHISGLGVRNISLPTFTWNVWLSLTKH